MAILLLIVLVYLSRTLWLPPLGEYLVKEDPGCRGEVAVVLGGDEGGRRVLRAGDLAREGAVQKVIVDGPQGAYDYTDDQLAIGFMVRRGYPKELFIGLPIEARSTKSEAALVVAELKREGVHRFVLVTSDFHTRRAARIFRKATAGSSISFCTVGSSTRDFSAPTWWQNREGQKVWFFEMSKTIAEWLGV